MILSATKKILSIALETNQFGINLLSMHNNKRSKGQRTPRICNKTPDCEKKLYIAFQKRYAAFKFHK